MGTNTPFIFSFIMRISYFFFFNQRFCLASNTCGLLFLLFLLLTHNIKMLSLRHEHMDDFFQVYNTTDYGTWTTKVCVLVLTFLFLFHSASTESQSFISSPHLRNYTTEDTKSTRTVRSDHFKPNNCLNSII